MADKLTLELLETLKKQSQLQAPRTSLPQPSTQGKSLFEQLNQSLSSGGCLHA